MGNSNSGRGGLPHAVKCEILRLLTIERLTDREISRRTGVHHCTIFLMRRRVADLRDEVQATNTRCPGCGGLIVPQAHQCQRCYLEKTKMPQYRTKRVARIKRRRHRRRQKPNF